MKKRYMFVPIQTFLVSISIVLFFCLNVNGQDNSVFVPAEYPTSFSKNYIRIWDAKTKITDPTSVSGLPLNAIRQTTEFFDESGRAIQVVVKQGTLTGSTAKDLVEAKNYDTHGRETRKYLPFAATDALGGFKLNAFQQQQSFYQSYLLNQNETFYYGKTEYELSSLNRIISDFTPGNNWVNQGRGKHKRFLTNTSEDSVRIWEVNDVPGQSSTYSTIDVFAANQLSKTITTDENGKHTIEFRDNQERIILSKVQIVDEITTSNSKAYTGWLCTYYIFDDLNRLRAVIQPEGVKALAANNIWNISMSNSAILDEQCFLYKYDNYGRMIMKKAPGAAQVYMIYDVRDRLIYKQDGIMRANSQWHATLYDELNRPIVTGLVSYTGSFLELTSIVATQTMQNQTGVELTADISLMGKHAGRVMASHSIVLENFETIDLATFEGAIIREVYPRKSPILNYRPVNRNPLPSLSSIDVLTNTFYDDYTWQSEFSDNPLIAQRDVSFDEHLLPINNDFPYAQQPVISIGLKGLVTGTRTRVLGNTEQYLYSVNFYDEKSRIIQTQSTNITGSIDITNTQYSWSGLPLLTIDKQQKGGTLPSATLTLTKLSYDDLWRVSKVEKKLASSSVDNGNLPSDWIVLAENLYDELGQIKERTLGRKKDENEFYIGTPLAKVKYEYNIHGWLLGINRDYTKDNDNDNNLYFGFDLGYDKVDNKIIGNKSYVHPQFNGNISGVVWKSKGDGEKRKYDFTYDAANRLTTADFNQYSGTDFIKDPKIDFTIGNLSYDANGNIQTMKQMGMLGLVSGVLDDLTYQYKANSNKLLSVSESIAISNTNHKSGDFTDRNRTEDDYDYDVNGNLLYDKNKDIASIVYNHLNLPSLITITGKGTIAYTYDAAGNKLKKVTTDNTSSTPKTTSTLYLGGSVYENNVLQFLGMEEGRVRLTPASGNTSAKLDYDYFLKDHLGNIRTVVTDEQKKANYIATMETANRSVETQLFSGISETLYSKDLISGYPTTESSPDPNDFVSRLDGNQSKQIGPAILLKVMAGDEIDVGVNYFYKDRSGPDTHGYSFYEIASPLAYLFMNGAMGNQNGPETHTGEPSSYTHGRWMGAFVDAIWSFWDNNPTPPPGKPKAFLNWMFMDDLFQPDNQAISGAQPVNGSDAILTLSESDIKIKKNGYLYIFVSNVSEDWPVFFDNLSVEHRAGPLREETHYYPFGLTMAGISSKALGGVKNKKGYNGNELQNEEFSDGSGLELYDFNARTFDPQIGRFHQIDPLTEDRQESWTPYHFSFNNPILFSDPDGKNPIVGLYRLYQLWRAYRTAEAIVGTVKNIPTLPGSATLTNMVITTDAKGNLVAIPESQLKDHNAKASQDAKAELSKPVTLPADTKKPVNVNTETDEESGSYTNYHKSGMKYHGKGTEPRAAQSAKEKAEKHNDPLVNTDHTKAKNEREGFKQESKRLDSDKVGNTPGHKNPNNYNKRDSPGTKYRKEDEGS